MADPSRHVRLLRKRSRADVSAQLAVGWARITATQQGAFADAMGVDVKTVRRALCCETMPELHTALNSLLYDPTALDEVLSLYGYRLQVDEREAANDLDVIAALCNLAGQYSAALADGRRDPRETCQLADAIRPLMKTMSALCAEADAIKAG